MAPKTASAKAAAPKKSAGAASHGTYQDMIKDAIIQLKERNGSSRQTLKKYVKTNNSLGSITDATFTSRFNAALAKGSESGVFARPKGVSGPVKLGKPTGKTTKATSPAAPKTEKAAKPKIATKTKASKTAAPKKTATKKTATKAAAPKKTATKANTGKSRKTATAAPAVEDKPATVLGKTKSGRVTKSKAPQTKSAPKKAATKKAAPKKAVAAKK